VPLDESEGVVKRHLSWAVPEAGGPDDPQGGAPGNALFVAWGFLRSMTADQITGQERDTETNLDHFWFRQYASTQGRWLTPDPAGQAAADPTNPQSWNRYAYVMNNPTNLTDPLGLRAVPDEPLGSGSYWCPPSFVACDSSGEGLDYGWSWGVGIGLGGGVWNAGGGGGGGAGGGAPPTSPPNTGGQPPLSGETLGIPNWFPLPQYTIWQALGIVPTDNWCDFGPCVFGFQGSGLSATKPWWKRLKDWAWQQYYGFWPKKNATVNFCSEVHGLDGRPMTRIDQAAGPNPYNPNGGNQRWIDFQSVYIGQCGEKGGVAVCRPWVGIYGPEAICQCCK
jgi:RHS repeat-associated protein